MATHPADTVAVMEPPLTNRLLAGLTGAQRAAVTHEAGLLCIVAGAGSGKTTVLTRRVGWRLGSGSARPEHVLVLTFTRKAASELRSRLTHLGAPAGIRAGTFHSAAFDLLRRHWADRDVRPPSLIADPARLLRHLAGGDGFEADAVPALVVEIGWARARLVEAEEYPAVCRAAGRQTPLPAEEVATIMTRYAEAKRRKRVIDLDDLVVLAGDLLHGDSSTAAAERWRVRHLFVDEFQDVNPAQFRLLEGWRGGRDDLCTVGDPRQAIYAWNGSDPDLLRNLPALVPGMHVVRLDENHRSAPHIVSAAQAVLGDTVHPSPLPAREAAGPPPVLAGFDDEEAEAAGVLRWLRSAHRPGRPWRHLAVLARTNARLDTVADALHRAGIPVRRPGITASVVDGVVRDLRRLPRGLPLRAALVDVTDALPPEVLRLADDYAAEEGRPTVGGFLAWLAADPGAADTGTLEDAVELATFHRAKGLEWPCVAVIGLEDGTVPIGYATSKEALAEEQRLVYVALTRAEDELWCSWASDGPRVRRRQASPFLRPLRSAIAGAQPAPTAVAPARIAKLRAQLEDIAVH